MGRKTDKLRLKRAGGWCELVGSVRGYLVPEFFA